MVDYAANLPCAIILSPFLPERLYLLAAFLVLSLS